jgi:hypothetical protein
MVNYMLHLLWTTSTHNQFVPSDHRYWISLSSVISFMFRPPRIRRERGVIEVCHPFA